MRAILRGYRRSRIRLDAPSRILAVVKECRTEPLIKPRAVILIATAAAVLTSCQIGGDDAEASTPPPVAPTISTPDAPVTTAIPTATSTATPVSTAILPSATSTSRANPPTPAPIASPTATRTPTRSGSPARGSVGRVAVSRGVDALQRPIDVADRFGPDERVHVSVEFKGVRAEAVLGITWKRDGEELFTFETDPQSSFSRGFFAFFFDPGGGVGEFEAEILIDGEVLATANFTVGG